MHWVGVNTTPNWCTLGVRKNMAQSMKEFSVFFAGVLHFEFCTALGCAVGLMEMTVILQKITSKLFLFYFIFFQCKNNYRSEIASQAHK